jgi:hypothetical protein
MGLKSRKCHYGFLLWEVLLALNFLIILATIFCYAFAFSVNKIKSSEEEMHACFLARSCFERMLIYNNLNNLEKTFSQGDYVVNVRIENDPEIIGFKNIFLKIKWQEKELNFVCGVYATSFS